MGIRECINKFFELGIPTIEQLHEEVDQQVVKKFTVPVDMYWHKAS